MHLIDTSIYETSNAMCLVACGRLANANDEGLHHKSRLQQSCMQTCQSSHLCWQKPLRLVYRLPIYWPPKRRVAWKTYIPAQSAAGSRNRGTFDQGSMQHSDLCANAPVPSASVTTWNWKDSRIYFRLRAKDSTMLSAVLSKRVATVSRSLAPTTTRYQKKRQQTQQHQVAPLVIVSRSNITRSPQVR